MALARGRDLGTVLRDHGPLAPAVAAQWSRQICLALAAAHAEGIVHRDIKPTNVMVDLPEGAGPDDPAAGRALVTVLDFGIAHFDGSHDLTRLGTTADAVGSVPWMAPEQAAGRPIDHRADLYSLGCLLYQLLTGMTPFGDRAAVPQLLAHASEQPVPVAVRRPGVPPALDELVMALLAKNPDERPGSAGDVAGRLAAMSAQEPGGSQAGGPAGSPTGTPADTRTGATLITTPEIVRPEPKPRVSRRTLLIGLGIVVVGGGTTTTVLLAPDHGPGSGPTAGGSGATTSAPGATSQTAVNAHPVAVSAAPPGTITWHRPVAATESEVVGLFGDVAVLKGGNQFSGVGAADGKTRWVHPLPAPDGGSDTYKSTLGADGALYIIKADGTVQRLSPADGRPAWTATFPLPADPPGDRWVIEGQVPCIALSLDGSTLYIGQAKFVTAVRTSDGSQAWTWSLPETDPQPIIASLIATDHEVLIHEASGSSNQPPVHCLDVASRTIRWQGTSSSLSYRTAGRLLADDWGSAGVSLVRLSDGVAQWSGESGSKLARVFADAGLFVTQGQAATSDATTSHLSVRSLDDGHLLWTFDKKQAEAVCLASTHSGKSLIFGTADQTSGARTTVAADAVTGRTLWQIENSFPLAPDAINDTSMDGLDDDGASAPPSTARWIPVLVFDPGNQAAKADTAGSALAGLDPATGSALWQLPRVNGDLDSLVEDPATGRTLVLTVDHDGKSDRGTPQELYFIG
jgi:outer membrane protein assembly factor BamB